MAVQLEELKKALDEKKYEDLLERSQEYIAENPEDYKGYLYSGKASVMLEDVETAFKFFNASLAREYNQDEAHFCLAQIAQGMNEIPKAKQHYLEVLEFNPTHATALAGAGDLCLIEEFYDKATDYYKKILEQGEIIPSIAAKCAQAYISLEDAEAALDTIEKYAGNEFNEAVSVVKSTALTYLKQEDSLLKELELLHTNVPNNGGYAVEYAMALSNAGEYKTAEEVYSKTMALDVPDEQKASLYSGRAMVRVALDNNKAALEDLDKAIELDPNDYVYKERSSVRLSLEDTEGALEDLDEAIKLFPDSITYLLSRGQLCAKLKNFDKAIQDFAKLLQLDEDSAEAYYGLGTCYFGKGEKSKALEFLQRADALGYVKATQLMVNKFAEATKKLYGGMQQKFAKEFEESRADNEASEMLSKAFGKLWVADLDKSILSLGEEISNFSASFIEDVLSKAAKDMFLITPEAILIFEGDDDPVEAYYQIVIESPDALILELQPTKGGARSQLRMYEYEGNFVLTYPYVVGQDVSPRYFNALEPGSIEEWRKKRLSTKVVDMPYVQSIENFINEVG